jgi:hypothetical protein
MLWVGCLEVEFGGATGGSAGAGGASSTGGTGAGGAAAAELCGNGVDDDLDELVDCDDDDCAVLCELVPRGWLGFVSVRSEGCSDDETLAQTAYVSAAGSATCDCSCDAPLCDATVVATAYGQSGCGGGVLSETLSDGECVTVGNYGDASLRVVAEDSCGAPTALLPPPEVTSVDLCVAGDGACVYRAGADLPCPPGFPESSQLHGAFVDGRSCTTDGCSCSSPTCGTVTNYVGGVLCMGIPTPVPLDTCVSQNGQAWLTFTPDPNPSCTPSGTSPATGSVTVEEPLTVCCR